MTPSVKKLITRFSRDDLGVTLVEYGIALSLALLVGTVSLTLLGDEIEDSISAASTAMPD